jgi:glycosyltransferase involved in cell wall biosynthesis
MSDLLIAMNALRAEGEKFLGTQGLLVDHAISVIIPSRNEGAKVARTVRSLVAGRSRAFPLEVVVVDDASTDLSCEGLPAISAEASNVSVVVRRLDRWSGIPYARNRGAEAASHPILIVTDANTIYPRDWDSPVRQRLKTGRILAGSIVDEQTGNCGFGLSLEIPSMGVKWITDPARYGGYVPVSPCTCTVIARDLFRSLGGYDETLPLYGAAEPEFSVRAWLAGYEIVNLPDLLVSHRFRPAGTRSDFHTANQRTLMKNYVRFACSYLPDDLLRKSFEEFARTLGADAFDSCMEELVREGVWDRRTQLRMVLRRDFTWLLIKLSEVARAERRVA